MRYILLLFAAVLLIPGSLSRSAAQETCTDLTFIKGVKHDLSTLNDAVGTVQNVLHDATKTGDDKRQIAADTVLLFMQMRHKYEDATVPDECEQVRQYLVKFISNSEDIRVLTLAIVALPNNSDVYRKTLDQQVDRIKAIGAGLLIADDHISIILIDSTNGATPQR